MKKRTLFSSWMLGLLVTLIASEAHAMVGSKLDIDSLSESEAAEVRQFIDKDVRADVAANFDERISAIASKIQVDPPMNSDTQRVLVAGVYATLQGVSPIPLDPEKFNRRVGGALDWMRAHGMLPHAVTVGVLLRRTWGDGYTAGFNYGAEMNFYIQGGKLKMTNYSLKGAQMGLGTPVIDVEYYVAFCMGSCFGGNPAGWYLGTDASGTAVAGGEFFAELGIDVSSVYKTIITDKKTFTVKDLYDSSTIYLGFGGTAGFGAEAAMGLYHYSQIGDEMVLANPGQAIDPALFSSQATRIKP